MSTSDIAQFTSWIATRLATLANVRGVVHIDSSAASPAERELRLIVYHAAGAAPRLDDLRGLALQLGDQQRGHYINAPNSTQQANIGGSMRLENRQVYWWHRDLARVEAAYEDAQRGEVLAQYHAGYSHAFHRHRLIGELAVGQIVSDRHRDLARLREKFQIYPPALRSALTRTYLNEARYTLDMLRTAPQIGDALSTNGAITRVIACLVQVLFALNSRYWVEEFGALDVIAKLPLTPSDFVEDAQRILSHVGVGKAGMQASYEQCEKLVQRVSALSAANGVASEKS